MTDRKVPGSYATPARPGQPGPADHKRTDPNPRPEPHPPFPSHEQTAADVETDRTRGSAENAVDARHEQREAERIRNTGRRNT